MLRASRVIIERNWRVCTVSWEKAIGLDNKLVFIRLVNWILAPKARLIDIQILSSLGDLGMFMPQLDKLVETEERNWISSCDCKIWVPGMLCLDECG